MAITSVSSCLMGPPPLPPGKRFLARSKKLSSTYLSFRDPAIESWMPFPGSVSSSSFPFSSSAGNSVRDKEFQCKVIKPHLHPARPRSRASYTTSQDEFHFPRTNLFRSQSEGNLRAKKSGNLGSQNAAGSLSPLDKCIKAIYGSWKNLMQRKCMLRCQGHYVRHFGDQFVIF